jgi:hypothetical protein
MNIFQARASGASSRSMAVKFAKVLTKLALGVNVKVLLITEEHNTSSGNQAREVVLLSIG